MKAPAARTLPALVDEMAERFPGVEAVVGGAVRLEYSPFRAAVREAARGLRALGIGPGDRVAILMGNRPEWLVADFAIASLGASMVSINTWATERELLWLLRHSRARMLVAVERFLRQDYAAMLGAIAQGGQWPESLERVIVVDGPTPGALSPAARACSWEAMLEGGARVPEADIDRLAAGVAPGDIACILYTSGSTSTPKGVPLQHYALIENMWNIGERQHLTSGDRLWLAVSLFWALACENALFAIMTHGGTIVLQEHFDPGEALALIERERCSVYYGTPNMTLALWEHPERAERDLSSLRTGVTIGSPEQVRLAAELGAGEICNVYGLTEVYGNSNITDARAPLEERIRSQGPPLPGMEVVIADPVTHAPLPRGETGEIKVRGYVTPGYLDAPGKSGESFDREGFFLTGDLGFLDERGWLHFRGRLKEMVKTGGINVAPVEVEEVPTLADSLGGGIGLENNHTFPICQALLDDAVLVGEDEIAAAMRELFWQARVVAEGGAAVGWAALAERRFVHRSPGPVVVIVSGGNVDMTRFAEIVGVGAPPAH